MMRTRNGLLCAVLGGALLYVGLPFVCYAQVTATSGAGNLSTVVSPPAAGVYTITGGTRPSNGTNLFHSFGNFSLSTPETANFNNDSGLATTNILARVTGGNPSNIFGTIQTTGFGAANLFLMNPFGIFFGPTAKLSVGGSFHATTADYIKLGTDGVFYADPALPTMLNVAPPSAFGFLTANPKSIDVQAGVFSSTLNQTSVLQVPSGGTLSLVGGPVNVGAPSGQPPAGFVRAPGGRVNLVSVASAGEAPFDGTGFSVDSFQQLGPINITGRAVVDGREVFIRGGELVINNAAIFPGFFRLVQVPMSNGAAAPATSGGEVNISIAKAVTITGSAPTLAPQIREWGIQTFTGVALAAGGAPGAPLDSPNVTINAGSFLLSGQPAAIRTTRNGPGKSPLVTITADTVEVRNGAFVNVGNSYSNSALEGAGGIVVNARDVTLSSDGNSGFTGLAAQGTFNSAYSVVGTNPLITPSAIPLLTTADSGSITINATGKLTMLGRASATTDSFSFGNGGTVTISAGDVLLIGGGANTGVIAAQSLLVGSSGNVAINATGKIDVQNGFRISTNTGGSGNAGEVKLTAPLIMATGADTRIQSGTGQSLDADLRQFALAFDAFFRADPRFRTPIPNIPSDPGASYRTLRAILGVTPRPGDLMDVIAKLNALGLTIVTDLIPGDGGKVSITRTPKLTLDAGARLETSTLWDGNAGAIVVDVGSVSVKGGASIRSRSGGDRSDGIFIGTGSGGDVTVTASDAISVSGANSTISTTTFGDGKAGNIFLSANQVDVENSGSVTSDSGGVLAGQLFAGAGGGGDINITAPQITLLDGAAVSASSRGTASAIAGNVNIVTNDLTMTGNSSITTQSRLADGGNISITTNGSQLYLLNSQITTSVQSGVGSGGNITLGSGAHPVGSIILNGSQVRADAFGGPGGNIGVFADTFLVGDSVLSASSALSAPGVINIQAKFTNLSGNIAQLPETVLQGAELLRAACAARLSAGKASSLVVAGREGVPLEPGGVMPSPLIAENPTDPPSRSAGEWEPLPGVWRVSLHSKCSM